VLAADLNNGYDEFALDNNGRSTYSDQPGVDTQELVRRQLARHVSRLGWRAPHHGHERARTRLALCLR
jgi:hypothetical protein